VPTLNYMVSTCNDTRLTTGAAMFSAPAAAETTAQPLLSRFLKNMALRHRDSPYDYDQ